MPRHVVIVPHTHWDREWYSPFQTFRMKLVDLVDRLLPLLESDPGFAHFQLDGQMAVVDDYLEIRPEAAERLRTLAAAGRLSMGPWYILMDEFLVSGETMVRDLQLGIDKAAAFGGAMRTGYLPDMFGHVAQMPQLLAQFGFTDAVVWRGVPAAVDRNAFWWEAPDGSTVRAEYLLDGYGNGAYLPDDAKELVAMMRRYETMFGEFLADDAPLLWMNGTDHLFPKAWLSRVVAEANDIQDDYVIRVGSLDDYVAMAPRENLPRWAGELRSGARANLLMGVASNRVDVKQAAAAAERTIERMAEPLAALFQPADAWPGAFLDQAWALMIRNSAHDSICACSVDEVNLAVVHRFQEAAHIGAGVTERAVTALARSMAEAGPVVANPSPRPRSGVVQLVLPGHDPIEGTQLVKRRGGADRVGGMRRADVASLAVTAVNNMPELHDVQLTVDDDGVHIELFVDPDGLRPKYAGDAGERLLALAEEDPDGPTSIAMVRPENQRVLAYVHEVPGFGWRRWTAGALPVEPVAVDHAAGAVEGPSVTVGNGRVAVVIDTTTGTFAVDDVEGFGRIVDDGDSGDTYNYNPPRGDQVIDTPDAVAVRVIEAGPVRARVAIDRTYTWPHRVERNARVGGREVATTTTVELRAGSPLVWVTTEIDNRCEDHRVRAWLPLPEPATTSAAECAFAVVERGLEAEGGLTERGLPTYPARRFVQAGGLTVVHDGLLEYELVDIEGEGDDRAARQLAVTLLRCTGLISRGPMAYRPAPAGPMTPSPGAQMPGRQVLRYAVALGQHDPYGLADEAFVDLPVADARGGGDRPDEGSELTVTGAEVTAVHRRDGQLVVRVVNASAEPTTVRIDGRRGWLVDLRGRAVAPFEGSCELAPWRIATFQLAD